MCKWLLPLFLIIAASAKGQPLSDGICTDCGYEKFLYSKPTDANINPSEHGLLLFLHGNRGNGPNGYEAMAEEGLPLAMKNKQIFQEYAEDFFVFIPWQDNAYGTTEYEPDRLKDFLDYVLEENPSIDPDRVVIMGFSKGGKGAWNFIANYPEAAAGALIVMGGLTSDIEPESWCDIPDIPIWAISTEFDALLPPYDYSDSEDDPKAGSGMVINHILNNCPDRKFPPELHIIKTKGHHGWDELFDLSSGFDIYTWMNMIDKNRTDNYPPVVSKMPDRDIVHSEFVFAGYAFDIEGDPVTYDWTLLKDGIVQAVPTQQFGETIFQVNNMVLGEYELQLSASDGISTSFTTASVNVRQPNRNSDASIWMTYMSNTTGALEDVNLSELKFIDSDDILYPAEVEIYVEGEPSDPVKLEINNNYNHITESTYRSPPNSRLHFSQYNAFPGSADNFQLYPLGDPVGLMIFTQTPIGRTAWGETPISTQAVIFFGPDPLPVTFVNFTGKTASEGVGLQWTTSEETGNSHFEVFRGMEGEPMQKIGEVPRAAPGKLINYYSFTDPEPSNGVFYYQIQSVDHDGHRDYTKVIRIALDQQEEFTLFPNPSTTGIFNISGKAGLIENPRLFNCHGQQVPYSLTTQSESPMQLLTIPQAVPGVYILQGWYNGGPVIRRILIEN